jgi:hypothetical protein
MERALKVGSDLVIVGEPALSITVLLKVELHDSEQRADMRQTQSSPLVRRVPGTLASIENPAPRISQQDRPPSVRWSSVP